MPLYEMGKIGDYGNAPPIRAYQTRLRHLLSYPLSYHPKMPVFPSRLSAPYDAPG
jgi:hypothetical protein